MSKLKECPCCGYPHDDVEAKAMKRILNKIKADAIRDAIEYADELAIYADRWIKLVKIYKDKLERGEV